MTELPASIQNLDLTAESLRFMRDGGYTPDDAQRAEFLYRCFLALCATGAEVTPSEFVDDFWHAHLADTRKYMIDCDTVCGRFIHHDPKIQGADMERRFAFTNELMRQRFGVDMKGVPSACGSVAASCGAAADLSTAGLGGAATSCGASVAARAHAANCGG